MSTDNRTNEPSEAMVKAAAKALRADEGFMEEVHSALEVSWSEYIARLVLVAAQGAAPQQIGRLDLARHYWRSQGYDYDLHGLDGNNDYEMGLAVADAALAALADAQGAAPQAVKDVHEPSHDRVYCVRCGGNWPCQPAPVPPSSDVDEDALAEVIQRAMPSAVHSSAPNEAPEWRYRTYESAVQEATKLARAVAAWLKDGGAL